METIHAQSPLATFRDDALEAARLVAGVLRRGESGEAFRERRRVLTWSATEAGLHAPALLEERGTAVRIRHGHERLLVARPGDGPQALRDAVREAARRAGSAPFFKAARAVDQRVPGEGPPEGLAGEEERTAALAHAISRAVPDPRGLWMRLTLSRVTTSRAVVTPRTLLDCGTYTRLEVNGTIRRGDGERPFSYQSARPFSEAMSGFEHALREAIRPVPRVPPPAGLVDVVLSPQAAAVFFHEAVGHPLEREGEGRASVLARVRGAVVTAPGLHVVDDPTQPALPGSYLVDDEGVPARPVPLLDDGRVAELLSDRRTAGAESNGHGRASDFRRPPRPRLSNLMVAPGRASSADLLSSCGDGILIREISAGSADPESGRFFLAVERAELLRRGKPGASLLPFMVGGEVLAALANVEGERGDLAEPASGLSLCLKGGDGIPVGGSSPAVVVRGLTVRGPR